MICSRPHPTSTRAVREIPDRLVPGSGHPRGHAGTRFLPGLRARGIGTLPKDSRPCGESSAGSRSAARPRAACLTKVPLVRWDSNHGTYSTHFVSRKTVAPDTGVLLHFKFLHDFHDRPFKKPRGANTTMAQANTRDTLEKLRKNPDMRSEVRRFDAILKEQPSWFGWG